MSPTGDLNDAAGAIEYLVTGIGVRLQIAAKVSQHRLRVLGPAIWRESEPDGGVCRAAIRAIIHRMDPKPRRLRLAAAGIEHRHGSIISAELRLRQNRLPYARHHH